MASQFAAFSQDIALPVEEKAPALPPDMAECFNSSFQGDLSGLAKIQALLKSIQRPSNANMNVKPTNKEIFTIRHGSMPSLRKADCSLQNVHIILVKSSYSMMKVADDLAKAEKGDQSVEVGDTIKSVLEAVTLNALALQHMDQLRRDKFLTVLPHYMKSLAERPKGSHDQLFGDITKRQIEAKAKAEVVASFMPKPKKRPLSGLFGNPNKRARTTAGNIEARGYTNPSRGSKNVQSFPTHRYPAGKTQAGKTVGRLMVSPCSFSTSFISGLVKARREFWSGITSDQFILDTVSYGVRIPCLRYKRRFFLLRFMRYCGSASSYADSMN